MFPSIDFFCQIEGWKILTVCVIHTDLENKLWRKFEMVKNALKIVLKGDQGVGKTTIAAQFAEKVFDLK